MRCMAKVSLSKLMSTCVSPLTVAPSSVVDSLHFAPLSNFLSPFCHLLSMFFRGGGAAIIDHGGLFHHSLQSLSSICHMSPSHTLACLLPLSLRAFTQLQYQLAFVSTQRTISSSTRIVRRSTKEALTSDTPRFNIMLAQEGLGHHDTLLTNLCTGRQEMPIMSSEDAIRYREV